MWSALVHLLRGIGLVMLVGYGLMSAFGGQPGKAQFSGGVSCHPSYTGACLLSNASDYDCAGGGGNGPYFTGRVTVVGPEVYGLDRDGDGIGCN